MSAQFEQLVEAFGDFQARISHVEEPLAHIEQMQAELTDLEAVAKSAGDEVTVVAGPGGSVKRISLTTGAMRQSPAELEAQLMSTLQQAVAAAARKQAAIVDEHMGGQLHLMDQVLQAQATALDTSVEALRSAVEQQPPKPVADDPHDDDDYDNSQRSIKTDTGRPRRQAGGSAGDEFLRGLFGKEER